MAEPVKITIPAAVAAFVRPGILLEERLRGAAGQPDLPPHEQVLLLFCLGKDADPQVREVAGASLAALDQQVIKAALQGGRHHPALLHSLAQTHGIQPDIRTALLAQADLADVTRQLLEHPLPETEPAAADVDGADEPLPQDSEPVGGDLESVEDGSASDEADEVEDDGEEYLSKYKLAQAMGIGEKIKMALSGDKEWRKILIKDSNKLVSSGVIKNPRITEGEVLTIIKTGSPNDEVMRLICANREWIKNYPIRKALIENPKTPLANALRYLGTMNEKDVSSYAKSRNISSVIATQAKRLLLSKNR